MKKPTPYQRLSARLDRLEKTAVHHHARLAKLETPSITTTVTSPVSHRTHTGFYIDTPDKKP